MKRPAGISDADFARDRAARRGRGNPERLDVPLWAWLVQEGCSAYTVNQLFDGPAACEAGPGWCFDRFGCSETVLPDGRVVHVAGEHEDHYDPDFFIYNDVVVQHPDGRVELYGYDVEAFVPTDFHSATLVDDRIYIIGNLGYPDDRVPGTTQVYTLALDDFSMQKIENDGDCPGWLSCHGAELAPSGAAIIVRRGDVVGEEAIYENVDDFELDLATRTWRRLTRKPFEQWSVRRCDDEYLMLFEMSTLEFEKHMPAGGFSEIDEATKEIERNLSELGVSLDPRVRLEEAGCRYDSELFAKRYVPPIAHEAIEVDECEGDVREAKRLRVGAALVRYVEDMDKVAIKIEGPIDPGLAEALVDDVARKVGALHTCDCEARLDFRQ